MRNLWTRLRGPTKAGAIAALIAVVLVIIGIFRGAVPANPASILIALLVGALSWGVVAWAIATAASDVEADLAEDAEM